MLPAVRPSRTLSFQVSFKLGPLQIRYIGPRRGSDSRHITLHYPFLPYHYSPRCSYQLLPTPRLNRLINRQRKRQVSRIANREPVQDGMLSSRYLKELNPAVEGEAREAVSQYAYTVGLR
jgi:hypothetical protein